MRRLWNAIAIPACLVASLVLGCGGSANEAKTSAAANDGSVTLNVALRGSHYHLPNGLEVMLHPDRSLRNVIVDVRYHVGGKDDPPGRSGFAHLYEHLMFLGSKRVPQDGFSRALDDAGALKYNAHTNQDETEYFEILPPSQLPIALWLEADRMAHPVERLDEDTFRRERDVVKNEWRERYDNQPYGHVYSFVRAALFPEGHPYHRPPIGSVEDLERASLAEARAFAAKYYVPSNASVVVAGDFDVAEVKPLVDRLFGGIPAGTPPPAKKFDAVRLDSDRRVTVEADVESPRVVVAWPTPPPYARGWNEISFAGSLIAGMSYHRLATEQKVARDVTWYLNPGRLGSHLMIEATLEPGKAPAAAVDAIETRVSWASQVERSRRYPWPDFKSTRTQRMTRTVLDLAQLTERAERIQDYLEFFGDPDVAQTDLRQIQAVHAEDVGLATEQLLADAGKVVVVVMPKKGAPRSGRVVQ